MTKVQKFKRGSIVRIKDGLPSSMSHFTSGVDAIVQYSYKQKFHQGSNDRYSLIFIDDNGKPIGCTSWYDEDLLTIIDDDIKKGLDAIEWFLYESKNIAFDLYMSNCLNDRRG